jgi:hypothetical protein
VATDSDAHADVDGRGGNAMSKAEIYSADGDGELEHEKRARSIKARGAWLAGLTDRDRVAMSVLALLRCDDLPVVDALRDATVMAIARAAYEIADAMEAAREE